MDKIQKAMSSGDLFVLKPGVTVKLDVSGIKDPGERDKIAAALTKQLEANNCHVAPNAKVSVIALTELGRRREVAYRHIGGPGRVYNFQEYTSRVKVVANGQVAWEMFSTNVPGLVHLSAGETMEQYLQRQEHPNYEWLSKVELPKVVQKPTTGGVSLGTTQVTVSGLHERL